jgi:undecaprenyl-diphosphatase
VPQHRRAQAVHAGKGKVSVKPAATPIRAPQAGFPTLTRPAPAAIEIPSPGDPHSPDPGPGEADPRTRVLGAGEAVALGLIQGPTELLPVSSSAHLRILPWLCGREHDDLDPEHRKAFEVAVHAGAAVALLVGQRRLIAAELRALDLRRCTVVALSFAPPAAAGLLWERRIETRLGGVRGIAAGLALGAVGMLLADRRPGARCGRDAGPGDGLALGLAQTAALAPGVSRNGATLIAARLRCFDRDAANELSRAVALPVIAGATLLKGERLRRRGIPAGLRRALAVGAGAALASTLASQGLLRALERNRALWPYAGYRLALAGLILARARRGASRSG